MWGTIERKFIATSVAMRYPGTCGCQWVNYVGEVGRDTSGAYNAAAVFHPIASIGILRRERSGDGYIWVYYLSRYQWDWGYYGGLWGNTGIVGWNWSADGPGGDVCDYASSYLAPGYPGYGFGWGAGYGYGFNPLYWGIGAGMSTRYVLSGSFSCTGPNHFVRDDSPFGDDEFYIADSWPASLDVTRIPLDRVLN